MRHSNTYWALNKGTPAQLDHALRINTHDYKTARDFYAKIDPTTDDIPENQPVVTQPQPKKESKKKVVTTQPQKPAPMKPAKVIPEPKKAKVVPQKPVPMKATRVIQETPIIRRSSRNK